VLSGGSHSANVIAARGAASAVTGWAGRPVSNSADLAGSLIVAEASTGQVRRARLLVIPAPPAQPAQDLCDVRAEDTAVAVAFADDHVPQPPQEPAPALVLREQPVMQHVGGGQQVRGVPACPGSLMVWRVGVHHRRPQAEAARWLTSECVQQIQLIGGQCPGRS
jgi:hypothetical protein